MNLPASPIPSLTVIDLFANGEKLLQQFFETNPAYFLAAHGEPSQPGEAHEEIHGDLPAGWPFTHKYVVGYQDSSGQLAAMANVVSDLLAKNVWHLSTFIVETSRYGTGDSHTLYASLEDWARQSGARWMRLGVVQSYRRAESFWARQGYVQVATREGVVVGQKTNAIRVMVKPLYNQPLSEYYGIVERDRPAPMTVPNPLQMDAPPPNLLRAPDLSR